MDWPFQTHYFNRLLGSLSLRNGLWTHPVSYFLQKLWISWQIAPIPLSLRSIFHACVFRQFRNMNTSLMISYYRPESKDMDLRPEEQRLLFYGSQDSSHQFKFNFILNVLIKTPFTMHGVCQCTNTTMYYKQHRQPIQVATLSATGSTNAV